MKDFLGYTVTGLTTAAIYAVAASGLVVTYTTSGIFNFAHGAFGMLAAFLYWQLHDPSGFGLPTVVALILVVFVFAPVFGAVVERVIMRGLSGTTEAVKLVVTVSLMLALLGLAPIIWPSDVPRKNDPFFLGHKIHLAGVTVTWHRLIILAIAVLVAVLLRLLLYRTRAGVAMRAVVDDRDLAQLNGVRPGRTSMLAWSLGAMLAAIAGVLISAEQPLAAAGLTLLVFNAYAAAIVGRLRSLPLTFLGAVMLGLAESYVTNYLRTDEIGGWSVTSLPGAMPAILLFLVMLVTPHARLRSGGITQVRSSQRVATVRTAVVGAVVLVVAVAAIGSLIPVSNLIDATNGLVFAIAGLSLVPLLGYGGQISLAQMSFFGLGAVLMGIVGVWEGLPGPLNQLLGIVVAVGVCAVVGALIALPALRLTGIYLALATAAFALFMSKMVFVQQRLFPQGSRSVPTLRFWGLDLGTPLAHLITVAVVFGLCSVVVVALRHSPYGRRLVAMKDSPEACATLGLNLTRAKLSVFALSAAMAGLGGALLGRAILVEQVGVEFSLSLLMTVVVGGVGATAGALFGGMMLGSLSLGGTLFAANRMGWYQALTVSVDDLSKFTPGLIGISLGRNPDGAVSQIGDAGYSAVTSSPPAIVAGVGLGGALWALAFTDVIDGWSFTLGLGVLVLGVLPLLPLVWSRHPRRMPVGALAVVATLGAAAVPLSRLSSSNGMRVVFVVVSGVLVGLVGRLVAGPDPSRPVVVTPSPDEVGLGAPIPHSEVALSSQVLGISEEDFVDA